MPVVLPEEFQFSHEYAFFLHDLLATTLANCERAKVFQVTITPETNAERRLMEELDKLQPNFIGDQLYDWLETNGFH